MSEPRLHSSRKAQISTWIIIALYAIYAGVLIFRSSVTLGGQRWFCLLDDAMISMRYARNLAHGLGLVWNAGERVEGITNPGWTFIMAMVHLVEHNRAHTSLYIQVISALCLAVTIWLTARIAWRISRGSYAVTLCAAATTAFYYPLNYFSLYGMESGILALFITAAVALFLRQSDHEKFPWATYVILGFATIIRVDMTVPLIVVGGYSILTAQSNRDRLRHGIWLAATLLVFIGGQTLARLLYYGYPFPNTYYLKMTGFPVLQRMARGAFVTIPSIWTLLWPVLTLYIFAIINPATRRALIPKLNSAAHQLTSPSRLRNHPWLLPALIFAAQAAYSIYVGGDAWEENIHCNRYMVIAAPLLFVGMANAISAVLRTFLAASPRSSTVYRLSFAAAAIFYLVIINIFSVHPNLRRQILPVPSPTVQKESEASIAAAIRIQRTTPADAIIACDWAGALPYFVDRYVVDPLGKCDVHIAHLPIPRSHWGSPIWYKAFYPGHMKWDAEYTYSTYHPDVMAFFWAARTGVAFKSILNANYINKSISGPGGAYFVHR